MFSFPIPIPAEPLPTGLHPDHVLPSGSQRLSFAFFVKSKLICGNIAWNIFLKPSFAKKASLFSRIFFDLAIITRSRSKVRSIPLDRISSRTISTFGSQDSTVDALPVALPPESGRAPANGSTGISLKCIVRIAWSRATYRCLLVLVDGELNEPGYSTSQRCLFS